MPHHACRFCDVHNSWAYLFRMLVVSFVPQLLLTLYQAFVVPNYIYYFAQARGARSA
jgi:hypothetical protein